MYIYLIYNTAELRVCKVVSELHLIFHFCGPKCININKLNRY